MFLSDEGPMLETLDFTIRIGSTPTFLYFDLYLKSEHCLHGTLRLFHYFYISKLYACQLIQLGSRVSFEISKTLKHFLH